jgi:hypothetical protein
MAQSLNQQIACPLCGVRFSQREIERHASGCDGTPPVRPPVPSSTSHYIELDSARARVKQTQWVPSLILLKAYLDD